MSQLKVYRPSSEERSSECSAIIDDQGHSPNGEEQTISGEAKELAPEQGPTGEGGETEELAPEQGPTGEGGETEELLPEQGPTGEEQSSAGMGEEQTPAEVGV